MPRRTLWLILAVAVFSLACYERADRNRYGRWFSEVLDTIDRYYVEPVSEQKLFEGALNGMVDQLDDYSQFLSRSDATQFQEALDQQYGGIGIEVAVDESSKQITVMSPLVGTPAYKAGIRAGDKITSIDGQSTANLSRRDVVRLLRGKPGEAVALGVRRGGQDPLIEFHLVRALIKIDSILGDARRTDGSWDFFLPGDEAIGYIRINSFGDSTVGEFEAAMKWLTERKCRGLIVDLRNNPGGLLDSAEQFCDLFVPSGALIVSTRGRDARVRDKYVASGNGRYQDLPIVILVNGKSASASEIVAACLQDHHRATIVGERTWGKGTVQNVIPLENGNSLLKLTIASYWRPSGKNIHRLESSKATDEWGVKPDPEGEVPLDEKQSAAWQDKRRQRDVPASAHAPLAAAPTGAPLPADSPLEFDAQLERAVKIMKEKLSETSPAPSRAG
ncbi:MAG TPA: S41 family peptidase, partial [Pirellulales bacterium]|nr:S41 family peptidase [Pirellulales bacterium]